MKTRIFVSLLILVLAVLIISEGFATEKKITKRDYRFISGTWINEEYNSRYKYAKLVMHTDGTWDGYNRTSDTELWSYGYYVIVDKWTDSEGKSWYKMHVWEGDMFEGHPGAYEINNFSESGKVWESISDRFAFPTEIDKSHSKYYILYRQ
jgi:hypothetical protein